MKLPTVAIVGRPNVGKSSLFNCLAGRRIAIVDPTPGVTRDRISTPCPMGPGYVELVDTGGMGLEADDELAEHIENQIAYALAEADLIVFLTDAREGITPLDRLAAERLRRQGKPVLLAANKVDQPDLLTQQAELVALGFGEPLPVSARHALGIRRLTESIVERLGELPLRPPGEPAMKLAVVGRRNAGKSTFINALAGHERVIVSEKPGTTRDSVDVMIELDGRRLVLIDTAGVRRRQKIEAGIEFFSYHRALRSIRRADVVAMMIDASVPVGQADKDLANRIAQEFKPLVLVVNKWDLARQHAGPEDYQQYLTRLLPEVSYAPISLTSATAGLNIRQTVQLAEQLFRQAGTRVETSQLNQTVEEIMHLRGPSHRPGTKPPKLYYAAQIATAPPTIVCFVNDPQSFETSYQRFLLNQLRDRLPYAEVPIRLVFRAHRRQNKAQ